MSHPCLRHSCRQICAISSLGGLCGISIRQKRAHVLLLFWAAVAAIPVSVAVTAVGIWCMFDGL